MNTEFQDVIWGYLCLPGGVGVFNPNVGSLWQNILQIVIILPNLYKHFNNWGGQHRNYRRNCFVTWINLLWYSDDLYQSPWINCWKYLQIHHDTNYKITGDIYPCFLSSFPMDVKCSALLKESAQWQTSFFVCIVFPVTVMHRLSQSLILSKNFRRKNPRILINCDNLQHLENYAKLQSQIWKHSSRI